MKRVRLGWSLCALGLAFKAVLTPLWGGNALELQDGDRVVFLGGTLFDRDRLYSEVELALVRHFWGRELSFRNLGWDGDTVFGHARTGGRRGAVFGDVAEGFSKLGQQVRRFKPSVVLVAYGAVEAHAGPDDLGRFESGLIRLLEVIKSPDRQIVLLTPLQVVGGGVPLSDTSQAHVQELNANLSAVRGVILQMGAKRQLPVLDLFGEASLNDPALRVHGLHLNQAGYAALGQFFVSQCVPVPRLRELTAEQQSDLAQFVRRKNELFYNWWRPRNDAFVFGERKSEQVPVQKELPRFELLIAEQEQAIRALR